MTKEEYEKDKTHVLMSFLVPKEISDEVYHKLSDEKDWVDKSIANWCSFVEWNKLKDLDWCKQQGLAMAIAMHRFVVKKDDQRRP